jgi:hypothetical protein
MPAIPVLYMSRCFVVLAAVWMVVMTWRLYPQFGDAVRIDGRLSTVTDFIADTCGERVGPTAVTCLAEARERAQRLLRREQGKSVLLIEAPLLGYLLFGVPWRLLRRWITTRRGVPLRPLGSATEGGRS